MQRIIINAQIRINSVGMWGRGTSNVSLLPIGDGMQVDNAGISLPSGIVLLYS